MPFDLIKNNVKRLLAEIPADVGLVAAVKTRDHEEVNAAVSSGIQLVGENYVQEALKLRPHLAEHVKMHLIGHLQKNKVKKAVEVFDVIETVDSLEIAAEIDTKSRDISKIMPVLIEVNIAREPQKHGVFPENAEKIIRSASLLENVRVMGIMTMGFLSAESENSRPLFRETKKIFDDISSLGIDGVEMRWLSMGMSDSYLVAIEEGANLVRIGTGIFGHRK